MLFTLLTQNSNEMVQERVSELLCQLCLYHKKYSDELLSLLIKANSMVDTEWLLENEYITEKELIYRTVIRNLMFKELI